MVKALLRRAKSIPYDTKQALLITPAFETKSSSGTYHSNVLVLQQTSPALASSHEVVQNGTSSIALTAPPSAYHTMPHKDSSHRHRTDDIPTLPFCSNLRLIDMRAAKSAEGLIPTSKHACTLRFWSGIDWQMMERLRINMA